MRALAAIAAVLAIAATPATGADPIPKAEEAEATNYVTVSPVALPIIVDDQVVNYVFVRIRIELRRGADSVPIREKEPYFRDALVRAAHRTPFTVAGEYTIVDEARLRSAMLREARRIVNDRDVIGVRIIDQTPLSARAVAAR
jgi:hypothetical protein